MSLNFDSMSRAILSMKNNSESLYISGSGANAQAKGAGFFGRLFRSTSRFTNAAEQFLNIYKEKYGKGMRAFAHQAIVSANDFGLSVGVAKNLLKFAEGMQEVVKEKDPSVLNVCYKVFLDKLKTSDANFDAVMNEVRTLGGLLSGAKLSKAEADALTSALKGVTIPSEAALTAILVASDRGNMNRLGVPDNQLSVLLNTCRHVFDATAPMFDDNSGKVKLDPTDNALRGFFERHLDSDEAKVFGKIVTKLNSLANIAKHGPPTKAMILNVFFDLPRYSRMLEVEDSKGNNIRYEDMDTCKIDYKLLGKLIKNYDDLKDTVPYSANDYMEYVKGSIFEKSHLFQEPMHAVNDPERIRFFVGITNYVGSLTENENLLKQFKLGEDCPAVEWPITWSYDPAREIAEAAFANSDYGKQMGTEQAMNDAIKQSKSDLIRGSQTLTIKGAGVEQEVSVKCGKSTNEDDVTEKINLMLGNCKTWKQKYMLLSAVSQSGVMVLKKMKEPFMAASNWVFAGTPSPEHPKYITNNVTFNEDGSVLVEIKSSEKEKHKAALGKLDLRYRITPDGLIKTECFKLDFPDYVKNGTKGDPDGTAWDADPEDK